MYFNLFVSMQAAILQLPCGHGRAYSIQWRSVVTAVAFVSSPLSFFGLVQVLRFTVEATGMARHLCAPREVIVERVFKR